MSKKRRSQLTGQDGFTLLEAVLTMAIVSIAFLAYESLLFSVTNFNRHARQRTAATTLAQDKMEKMHNLGYDAIAAGTFTETGLDEDGTAGNNIYDRVTVVDDITHPGMKSILVTVTWSHLGIDRSVALRTSFAR